MPAAVEADAPAAHFQKRTRVCQWRFRKALQAGAVSAIGDCDDRRRFDESGRISELYKKLKG